MAYALTIVALIYFGRRISTSVTMVFGGLLILSNYNHTVVVSTIISHHKTSPDLICQAFAYFSRQLCQWQELSVMAMIILIILALVQHDDCYIMIMVMIIIKIHYRKRGPWTAGKMCDHGIFCNGTITYILLSQTSLDLKYSPKIFCAHIVNLYCGFW